MPARHTIRSVASAAGTLLRRRWAVPALAAIAVVSLEVARVYLLQALHARGVAQGPASVLLSLVWVLRLPADYLFGVLQRLPVLGAVVETVDGWHVLLIILFAFYFAAFHLLGSINRRWNRRIDRGRVDKSEHEAEGEPVAAAAPARRVTRRRLLRTAKNTVTGAAVAAGAYPLFVEPHRTVVTRRSFPVAGLPPALYGLTVVQLTDIHLGPWTTLNRVRQIVDETNALRPDLIALTGDYVLRAPEYVPQVASALAALRAKVGVVGVLGNHDWREGGPLCTRELTRAGVRMIDNDRLFVTPRLELIDRADGGLCVAGVGDLWRDQQLYDRALAGVPAQLPRLLLSHNPDVAEEPAFISSGYRVDLMLSGHTHGGQIRLPGLGAPVTMSHYGQKYARGLVQGPTCPVFISRGLGMAMLPLRLGSTPEIAVIELTAAAPRG